MSEKLVNYLNSLKQDENAILDDNIQSFFDYFEEFFGKYPVSEAKSINTLKYEDLVLAFILSYYSEDFNDVLNKLNKDGKFLKKIKKNYVLVGLILYFNDEEIKNLIDKLSQKINILQVVKLRRPTHLILKKYDLDLSCLVEPSEIFRKNPSLKYSLSFLGEILVGNALTFYQVSNFMKYHHRVLADYGTINLPREEKNEIKRIERLLLLIYNNYNVVLRNTNKKISRIKRDNEKIDELIEALKEKGEIKNIDDLLKLCPTEEAREMVTSFVLEHNNAVYEATVEKYASIKADKLKSLTFLFSTFGYDFTSLEVKEPIMKKDYEEIEKILIWLQKYNLRVELKDFALIKMGKIDAIQELLNKGMISLEFIRNNLYIIFNNSLLDIITSRIDILKQAGINIINYQNSLNILLSDNILKNLELLKEFQMVITKETKDINFLGDEDLALKIELLIEMGYFNLSCLDILNKSLEELYKIKILNQLGKLPLDYAREMNFNDYYVNIEDYLIFDEDREQGFDKIDLEAFIATYMINDQVLFINGVFVSKIKLIKNLQNENTSTLYGIFCAIIKGSYYTFDEIELLREALIPEVSELYDLVGTRKREK